MNIYGGSYLTHPLCYNHPKRPFTIEALLADDAEQGAGPVGPVGPPRPVTSPLQGPVVFPWPAASRVLLPPHPLLSGDLVYVRAYPLMGPPAPLPFPWHYLQQRHAAVAAAGTPLESAAVASGNGGAADSADSAGSDRGHQAVGRPKRCRGRQRPRFTPEQLDALEWHFARAPRPGAVERASLGATIGLTPEQVTSWFQNQRVFYKKQRPGGPQASSPPGRAESPPAGGHD
ncbi:uncharacterized protein LOC116950810 [Petromyzon marinus]|uniref:uncharacterized protein LOC116950810 n=1 Tax=Petromyzon marinus TaxID=7757 RepID=UPI003F6E500B